MEHMESKMQDHYEAMERRDAETYASGYAAGRKETAAREVAEWMIVRGYATGHGDTVADMLGELEGQAKARGVAEHYGEPR